MGPTILTVPRVLRRIFAEAGRDQATELPLIRLDPQWRCFFDDNTRIDLMANVDTMAQAMDRFAPGRGLGARATRSSRTNLAHLHEVSEKCLLLEAGRGDRRHARFQHELQHRGAARRAGVAHGRTVAKVIRGNVPDERLAQMLDHFTQYVGSNPYLAPAVLCGIGDMQASEGVWYRKAARARWRKGWRSSRPMGADLRTDSEVTAIEIENGAVRSVTANGERIACDALISNMDAVRTYTELVKAMRRARSRRRASSRPVRAWCSISG